MSDDNDASDKTEDPTQKRLDDAHDRGDVAKSQEINTWFIIAGATLVLSSFSGSIGSGLLMPMRNLIANSWMIHADGPGLLQLAQSLEYVLIAALGVPLLMLALAAIAGNMIQHRLVWSGESLKPKFSKVSPGAGLKRIFGKQAAANFGKGLFKLAALGAVMMAILWPERHRLESMVRFDPAAVLGATTTLTLQLMGAVVAMLAIVAIADYFFQYRQWHRQHRAQDQGNRQGARYPDRRERAAGEGSARDREGRRGDPGGALSCGRANHRLRDGSQARGFQPAGVSLVSRSELRRPFRLALDWEEHQKPVILAWFRSRSSLDGPASRSRSGEH